MENSDDKIVRMDRSRQFDEAGAPRQPIKDIDVANHMTTRGLNSDLIRHALGYLPDPERGAPDQDTLDVIAQVLPWAGSAEQAWTWYQTRPLPSFGNLTAEELVKQGRLDAVKRASST
jgi:hypothetical protein